MAYRKRPLRKLKKRAPRRAKTQKVSLAVKQYVKRTMHVDQENKTANFSPSGVKFGNVLNSTNMNMVPLLPYTGYNTIGQSITAGGRIGNEIKIRKIMLNYVLRPLPYSSTSPGNPFPAPVEVDMFLGFIKQAPGLLPGTVNIGFLFQAGSSSIGPSGLLNDLIADVNKDYWNIKKRWRHKLGFANYGGTGTSADSQAYANNDFKLNIVKKLDITKLCPKTFKFNDGNNTLQGNNLFMFYQCVYANGVTATSATQMAHLDYWVNITYEDA